MLKALAPAEPDQNIAQLRKALALDSSCRPTRLEKLSADCFTRTKIVVNCTLRVGHIRVRLTGRERCNQPSVWTRRSGASFLQQLMNCLGHRPIKDDGGAIRAVTQKRLSTKRNNE